MIFNGIDNQTVEIKITGYQFPDNNDGDLDSNWLNIYLNVKSKVGHWQTVDPSLTTWEIKELIKWFYSLSKNEIPQCVDLYFTEPNLSFKLLDKKAELITLFRIIFDYESRPQSATNDNVYFVDCLVNNQELRRIVTELEKELEKYSERCSSKYDSGQ